MGNIEAQQENTVMYRQIKSTLRNSRATLVQDVLGAGVLVGMMVAVLQVPGF